ncbi:MAG: puromycin-sensitive aminopeptidase [Parcubacteria group bacterium Gr01-1014_44]|nr:MAG: puromycin-sensitive aminopeptidase [Parcubacteria group bacterium Gr01-1014_44]
MSEKASCRLSDSVIPQSYNLELEPDFETFKFRGIVSINVIVRKVVHEITLHAADLAIEKSGVRLWLLDKDAPSFPTEVCLDSKAETATFVFNEEIPVGGASLEIDYTGVLNDKMAGFYRSKYTSEDGQEKYLATTQFEATDARRALPCWDEPALKATFDVTLVVPADLMALSNMPVRAVTNLADGRKRVKFDRSPVMSSYLLAFIVGELECVETLTNNGTVVRVYTVPGKSSQGQFALDIARRVLEFYNEYFGISYPLPKLDMVAIPDFAAGAMENWGLVTYRENAVLIDTANSSTAAHQRVAEVVAHELAHQWFGNLVTMEWWTNLWLNEGFATWMASFALDHLFPKWDIWTQFVGDEYASALSLDGLRSTHSIEVEVGHPDEISQIFDDISYSKGASVIRMIHDFIGADAFRTGLQTYLKQHAYGNAITEDLWQALGEASGQPVREIMDTWTKQPGYPLITVAADPKSSDDGVCTILQERFLAGGDTLTDVEKAQRWQIPLTLASRDALRGLSSTKTVLNSRLQSLEVPNNHLLKLNYGQVALVRVNYRSDQWQALAKMVQNRQLMSVDRYGLVSDALSLARAGHLSTSQLISLLASYQNERDYTVWTAVLGAVGALDLITEETQDEAHLASFARLLLKPIADGLSWNEVSDEAHTTKLLRGQILGALGSYGDRPTITQVASRFHDHVSGTQLVNPNLRVAVYSVTAQYGNQALFNILIGLYEKETLQEEKVRLLNALGRFTDSVILTAVLEYGFNSGKVRSGDFVYVLSAMGAHAQGRRMAWQFMNDNWEKISERYSGGGLKMLARIISLICDGFARAEDADMIEKFFQDHLAPSATRAITEAMERIRVRAAWYQRDKNQITTALAS